MHVGLYMVDVHVRLYMVDVYVGMYLVDVHVGVYMVDVHVKSSLSYTLSNSLVFISLNRFNFWCFRPPLMMIYFSTPCTLFKKPFPCL